MDWIIQKAVELGRGVDPAASSATAAWCASRASAPRAAKSHWRRVAIAACEQSGRNRIPEVRPTLGFPELDRGSRVRCRAGCSRPARAPIAPKPRPGAALELLIGSGGRAVGARAGAGARRRAPNRVALGPRVLRAETAPLAALAAIHALWGDFRG